MSTLNGPGEGTWSVFAAKVVEERDRLRGVCDLRLHIMERLEKERDEALAEVERLKAQRLERHLESWEQHIQDNDVRRAYTRGAEAMRKRCEELVKHNSHEDGIGMGSQRMERAIAALPAPEDEP